MTDRRSHWDTDLVEGVGRRLIPRYRSIDYCTDAERHRIYTLIEFVEDWRNSNIQVHWQGMTATERNLSEALGREQRGRAELEAAIARVRQLHSPTEGFSGYLWCSAHCESTADGDPTDYPCETIRALDGDA